METQNRKAYLDGCKKRAMVWVNAGDRQAAIKSFIAELSAHPETKDAADLARAMTPDMEDGELDARDLIEEVE